MSEPLVIRFSRSLYDPPAVRQAVAAFAELGRFEVNEDPATVAVRAWGVDRDTLDELANHALYHTILRSRRGAA